MLKVQEIREIIKLIDQSSITEFTYETDDAEISLKKGTTTPVVAANSNPAPAVIETQSTTKEQVKTEPTPVQKEEKAETEVKEETGTTEEAVDYDYEVVSPMLGTFYAAPSPEDDPYVSLGSEVGPDSIVCIVEAMKLFNEIEAEVNGEIVEILVEDGELVEYGQPLFRVKKK
jgi:acetyl-CoA carboxylase biotin carboxyl carrier protein